MKTVQTLIVIFSLIGATTSLAAADDRTSDVAESADTDADEDSQGLTGAASGEEGSDMSALYMGLGGAAIVLLPVNYIVGPFAPVLWAAEAAVLSGMMSDWQVMPMIGTAGTVVVIGLLGAILSTVAYFAAGAGVWGVMGGDKLTGPAQEGVSSAAQGVGALASGAVFLGAAATAGAAAAGVYWLTASDSEEEGE